MTTLLITALQEYKIWGSSLLDWPAFSELIIKFILNYSVILVLVRYLYYPSTKRKDYLFTYILIGTVIFLLCFLLDNVKLQIGFALGLFAIFGILRYRTTQLPIKEMTYLFIVIGLSVINALANKKISLMELLFTNAAVIGITFFLERVWLLTQETRRTILYERIELIKPEKREELMLDLQSRTGLKINRIEIGAMDLMRDVVKIRIYYFENENLAKFTDDFEK